jgi:type I restriction enzyme S subunit
MKWEKVKLGDIATCIQPGPFGSQLHNSDYSKEGTPIIMPKDIVGGAIVHSGLLKVSEEHVKRLSRHQVYEGNLMVARKGDVRKCAYITANENGWMTGSDCLKVVLDESKCYPKFIYYQLRSEHIGRWLEKVSIGATMPSLNTGLLSGIEMVLPPIEIQKQIAGILSVYDDLIENNQKQIKLLEEAAQRLYKEWFVDLRFPGHENTKIVDGVPEGWNICPFSSKVDIMSGGTPKTSISDYYNGRIPFYTPKDSDGAFFAYKTQINITEGGLKNCNSRLYPPKTVIITARGTVGKTTILAVPMAMNQSCYALKMKENDAPYYLFFALNNEIKALQTMANGGVFNTIIGKTFDSINIQIPKDPLIYGFEKTVRPFMEQIKNKLQANSKLVEARNRLLLKMMNGEVEV